MCLATSIIATTQSSLITSAAIADEAVLEEDSSYVSFGVISDTHVGPSKATENERLKKAFNFFSEKELDGVAVVGDLTDNGSQEQYDVFKSIKD